MSEEWTARQQNDPVWWDILDARGNIIIQLKWAEAKDAALKAHNASIQRVLEKKEAVTRNTAVLQMALEIADLRKELQFWACEGQRHDPEADKWRELAQKPKPTKADVKRMSEIARKMRIAAEDEPELRARIAEQDIELERLRKLLSEHDGQPESASGASQ